MSNDPFDQDDPFSEPASGGSLEEFLGKLVIIKPTSVSKKPSKFDGKPIDVVECEIIGVDTEEPGYTVTTTSYSGSLNTQIKTRVGKMVLGTLAKKKFDKGMGWNLEPATAENKADAKKVLQMLKEREEKEAAKADPFA